MKEFAGFGKSKKRIPAEVGLDFALHLKQSRHFRYPQHRPPGDIPTHQAVFFVVAGQSGIQWRHQYHEISLLSQH